MVADAARHVGGPLDLTEATKGAVLDRPKRAVPNLPDHIVKAAEREAIDGWKAQFAR